MGLVIKNTGMIPLGPSHVPRRKFQCLLNSGKLLKLGIAEGYFA